MEVSQKKARALKTGISNLKSLPQTGMSYIDRLHEPENLGSRTPIRAGEGNCSFFNAVRGKE